MRILIADDEEGVGLSTSFILDLEGHDSTLVSNGRKALEQLNKDGPFDVLITDNFMPVMTGIDLIQALRVGGCEIPVILISAFLSEGQKKELCQLPVRRILEKPFDLVDLLDAVSACGPLPA